MITQPTLFILGAGASKPYGFPSGWELKNQICAIARTDTIFSAMNAVSDSTGFSLQDLRAFAQCFKDSGLSSIDSFLGRRTEYADIGKAVIAGFLIPIEQTDAFNNPENTDDWYFLLWNALVSNVSNLNEFKRNRVRVISFNYDRSLEKYLHTSIIHTFNVTEAEALEALNHLNIQHVYGSLGAYGLKDDATLNTRKYGMSLDALPIQIATRGIKVIPEARSEDAIFQQAKEAFLMARNVCFLGFGFDSLNVERLGFNTFKNNSYIEHLPFRVVASTYQRTRAEVNIIHNNIVAGIRHDTRGMERLIWETFDGKNLQTLREFAWLLQ